MGQQQELERIRIALESQNRRLIDQCAKKIADIACRTGATWQGPVDGLPPFLEGRHRILVDVIAPNRETITTRS